MTIEQKEQGSSLRLLQGGGPVGERVWALVTTNAKAERLANYHLGRVPGVVPYLPMRASKSKRADAQAATPLFPSYVFVQVEAAAPPWALIRTAIGVHAVVKGAGSICRVPDALVARLKGKELFGLVSLDDSRPRTTGPRFSKGERLKIASGLLEGFDAVFDAHMPDAERVWVLLRLCGTERRVKVEASALQRKGA